MVKTLSIKPLLLAAVVACASNSSSSEMSSEATSETTHMNARPSYPLESVQACEGGTTLVRVLLNARGVPVAETVELHKSSGFARLDQAAIDRVKTLRYALQKGGDQPVESWVLIPVSYRLRSPDQITIMDQLEPRGSEREVQRGHLNLASSTTAYRTESDPPQPDSAIGNHAGLAGMPQAGIRRQSDIEKSPDDYNGNRPRTKFLGNYIEEYRFAKYADDWRQKIVHAAAIHYPEAARGKLNGSLILTVAIRADGSMSSVEINRSSGHKILDDAALNIVRMSSPYSPFPPYILRDTDIIEITRTLSFTRGKSFSPNDCGDLKEIR